MKKRKKNSNMDYNVLADIFYVPGKKKTRKRVGLPSTYVNAEGRKFTVEKDGSEWRGFFEDDFGSTEYVASTKKEVLIDALGLPLNHFGWKLTKEAN
jgi:hypothetical protein